MTNEQIKEECELMYGQIKNAKTRLEELRSICTHENTFEGLWSWRVGCYEQALICSDCGSLVRFKKAPIMADVFTNKEEDEGYQTTAKSEGGVN